MTASEGTDSPSSTGGGVGGDEGGYAADALTDVQRRLNELAVMLYTYLGVLQRDAPPAARAPDEADECGGDDAARRELGARVPEYAADVVAAVRDIDEATRSVEGELESVAGREGELLKAAEQDAVQSGTEMEEAAKELGELLKRVRAAVAVGE